MMGRLVRLVLGPGVVRVRDRFVAEELRSALEGAGQHTLVRLGR